MRDKLNTVDYSTVDLSVIVSAQVDCVFYKIRQKPNTKSEKGLKMQQRSPAFVV